MESKLFFETPDGLRLCGILSRPISTTQKCVILCHGLLSNKDQSKMFIALARELAQKGFASFRFDFRAHGESQGKIVDFTVRNQLEDLEGVLNFLQEKTYKEIGILGASFAGGAVSLFAAKHKDIIKAIILGSALIDYDYILHPITNWGRKHFNKEALKKMEQGFFRLNFFTQLRINKSLVQEFRTIKPWKRLMEVNVPILFIHGDKDDLVPIDQSIRYASAIKSATLKILNGARHGYQNNTYALSQSKREIIEFVKKYL